MKNPKVEFYFEKADKWREEFLKLREIILQTGLVEELKWGVPCYTLNKANVVLIHGFKEYCALLFHKGALLADPAQILIQQTEHVQAARQIRFTSLLQIIERESTLKTYLESAIEIEKSGKKVPMKKTSEYAVPEEFQKCLDEMDDLRKAFEKLTPGRQRGYLYHFSQPKLAKTREARIETAIPKILNGKGIDD
jgi:uncharacterized protein YdeI (YjbR/CyaY-like superfamily)